MRKIILCKTLGAMLATTAMSIIATPLQAQEAADEVASEVDDGAIIVTARRRNETLQETPIAMTAIAPSQLEGAAALTIGDLQGAAPSVLITVQATGAATANVSIRGIAFADVEKSFDPAVGINVDGVYIGTSTGQMLDFFDIESIEILRGPQGNLFGRNTIAGVINVRRTRPTGEWGGKFEASIGNYDQFGARGVLNVPIVPDVLAAKFYHMHQESGGYYRVLGTEQHRGGTNSENFGASFLLTPSDNFDALLTLEKQVQDFDPVTGPLSRPGDSFCFPGTPVQCNGTNNTTDVYRANPGGEFIGRYRAPAATLEMNFDAGAVKFTSVTSYRESKEVQQQDYSTGGFYIGNRDQKYHQFSQELRGAGKIGDSLDYVAGVYYFKSSYRNRARYWVGGVETPSPEFRGKSESYAGFIDLNWEIADRFRLSGGGRWTHDEKSMHSAENGVFWTASPTSKSWSKFTPKIGVDYRPTNELMLYASWSRGYRSGGFNGRGRTLVSATTPYDPETVDSFEAGIKTEWFDRKLALNVAAFHTTYDDIQQSTSIISGATEETVVTNAASAKIKGIEADLTARPVDGLVLRGSFGYNDANFNGFIVRAPITVAPGDIQIRTLDFSPVGLIYAPKFTMSANAEYTRPIRVGPWTGDIKLNAGYRYLSRYDQQITADPAIYPALVAAGTNDVVTVPRNNPRIRSDRQNLLDASLSFIWDLDDSGARARFTVFGRNLLDDRGTNTAFVASNFPPLFGFAAAREPRTYGVQVGFEF